MRIDSDSCTAGNGAFVNAGNGRGDDGHSNPVNVNHIFGDTKHAPIDIYGIFAHHGRHQNNGNETNEQTRA
jgi:hypothetical protein